MTGILFTEIDKWGLKRIPKAGFRVYDRFYDISMCATEKELDQMINELQKARANLGDYAERQAK